MAMTFASLGLGALTVDEKLDLVGQLWDELVATASPGELLSETQLNELRRRDRDAATNPDDWVAWEDALSATLKRLSLMKGYRLTMDIVERPRPPRTSPKP